MLAGRPAGLVRVDAGRGQVLADPGRLRGRAVLEQVGHGGAGPRVAEPDAVPWLLQVEVGRPARQRVGSGLGVGNAQGTAGWGPDSGSGLVIATAAAMPTPTVPNAMTTRPRITGHRGRSRRQAVWPAAAGMFMALASCTLPTRSAATPRRKP
jgi:hypothetical protein